MTNPPTRILLVDDHPILRKGLRHVVEADPSLTVVGEADDGVVALESIRAHQPDVAIVDINMPRMGGLDLAREVQQKGLKVTLAFLTMYRDEQMFNVALDLGVKGYVLKDNALAEIAGCVKAVAAGDYYITPSLSHFLINRSNRTASIAALHPGISTLSKTERRVLRLIAENKSSKEIAGELFIHPRTVDNHRTNICTKLGVHGSHALLRFVLEHKVELSGQ
jgi:DNA-binding NarL/FixJ family response regulator